MLKDWKFSIRKGAEYTTDENELHLLHSPTPLKSSPAASSNLHPYATHLYEHRRLSYSTTLAPSHISIPIAHTPRPVLLHMPSPFVTFRKLYYRLITKGAHNGDAFHTDMNNLPAEVKQREAFTQDDILGAVARGSLEEVRRVKKETGWIDGRHVLDSRGPEGETLLHVALLMNSEKHDEIAEYLVAKRPNLVNAVYEGANFTGEHCCHCLQSKISFIC
ncbi:hypothetical protein BC829DRAFT_491045 [Chytridium lagenaria]|nr:hypothetical protein BC829DRAFT_491045 [Chytridium lagenaria]